MGNVGGVRMDKDAVYIDLHRLNYSKPETLEVSARRGEDIPILDVDPRTPAGILRQMQDIKTSIDSKMKMSELQIFKGTKMVRAEDAVKQTDVDGTEENDEDDDYNHDDNANRAEDDDDGSDEDSADDGNDGNAEDENSDGPEDEDLEELETEGDAAGAFYEAEYDDEEAEPTEKEVEDEVKPQATNHATMEVEASDLDGQTKWKVGLAQKAAEAFMKRQNSNVRVDKIAFATTSELPHSQVNLMELVYGKESSALLNPRLKDTEEEDSDADDDNLLQFAGADNGLDDDFLTFKRVDIDEGINNVDCTRFGLIVVSMYFVQQATVPRFNNPLPVERVQQWLTKGEDCLVERIRNKFVTGDWSSQVQVW
jgi:ribosome biogenesis protein BMS1